jgi:opacity protein-like surface antigen
LIQNCGLVGIDSGSSSEHYFAAMKKLLFLGACLVALASQPVRAQTSAADIVVMKVIESYGRIEFFIARAGSKPEHRELGFKQLKEKGEDRFFYNGSAEYTRSLLMELAQQGYTLTTTYTSGGVAGGPGPTTLVFTKRQ